MMAIDWIAFALGTAVGAGAGALFFAGLALGMRLALRSQRTLAVLLGSAALRIGALLGLGWLVAGQGASALAGFALAFLVVRVGIVAFARKPASDGGAQCS